MMTTAEAPSAPAATTVDATLFADAVTAIQTIESEVNGEVIESRDLVRILTLASLAKAHAFIAGEGGVGKSFAAERLMLRLPGDYYRTQFSKDMTRDELYGPPDIGALQNGRYERDVSGMMPEANMVLGDEFSDASTMIARSLLNPLNERILRDGRRMIKVPLWSFIATGNFWIEAHELQALFDRLALRYVQPNVTSSQGRMAIWRGQIERRANDDQPVGPVTQLAPDAWQLLHLAVDTCVIPQDVLTTVDQLLSKTEAEQIRLSNRRVGEGFKIAQAHAVLHGRTTVTEEDLHIFKWVLPNHPDDFTKCAQLTAEFAGKVAAAVEQLTASYQDARAPHEMEDANGVKRQVMGMDEIRRRVNEGADSDPDQMREITADIGEVSARIKLVKGEVEDAIKDLKSEGRDPSELDALLTGIKSDQTFIQKVIFG
jgi:MoxR-like ATPase